MALYKPSESGDLGSKLVRAMLECKPGRGGAVVGPGPDPAYSVQTRYGPVQCHGGGDVSRPVSVQVDLGQLRGSGCGGRSPGPARSLKA